MTIKRMKIEIKNYPEISLKVGNGDILKISKYVECLLEFKKIKNVKFKVKLFCSPNLPNDIILGNDFMIRNNVIIDFNQMFIKIDNFEIEIEPNKYDSIDNIESELIKNVAIHKSENDI
ncbi:hypothetical protein DMUE_1450 [Dictyocoela muelleri]|nr:hypothetical protein DMUE_1450 [Dictyocoela muelleri]